MSAAHLAAIAAGGAAGAVARYLVVGWITSIAGTRFPWGTLTVNVTGSFLLGLAWVLLVERWPAAETVRSLVSVGFLGAFTTFSTFSLESYNLLFSGHPLRAGLYMLCSVGICLLATGAGMLAARMAV